VGDLFFQPILNSTVVDVVFQIDGHMGSYLGGVYTPLLTTGASGIGLRFKPRVQPTPTEAGLRYPHLGGGFYGKKSQSISKFPKKKHETKSRKTHKKSKHFKLYKKIKNHKFFSFFMAFALFGPGSSALTL